MDKFHLCQNHPSWPTSIRPQPLNCITLDLIFHRQELHDHPSIASGQYHGVHLQNHNHPHNHHHCYDHHLYCVHLCIAGGQYHGVHLQNLLFSKTSVRAVGLETPGKRRRNQNGKTFVTIFTTTMVIMTVLTCTTPWFLLRHIACSSSKTRYHPKMSNHVMFYRKQGGPCQQHKWKIKVKKYSARCFFSITSAKVSRGVH